MMYKLMNGQTDRYYSRTGNKVWDFNMVILINYFEFNMFNFFLLICIFSLFSYKVSMHLLVSGKPINLTHKRYPQKKQQ